MKKLIILLSLLLTVLPLYCQEVVEVIGKANVEVGQVVKTTDRINLTLGSQVKIVYEGKEWIIKSPGTLESHIKRQTETKIKQADTSNKESKTRQVGTASARASDQAAINDVSAE